MQFASTRASVAVFALETVAVHPGAVTVAAETEPTPMWGADAIDIASSETVEMMGRRRKRMAKTLLRTGTDC
jgi:hypothetical protein